MHPRIVAIVVGALLLGGIVGRGIVAHYGLLPISEEVVLKRAVALSVSYLDGSDYKTTHITQAGELQQVLSALHIRQDCTDVLHIDVRSGVWLLPWLKFQFPDGSERDYEIGIWRSHLGDMLVEDVFFEKLSEVVSRHEGHPVNIGMR